MQWEKKVGRERVSEGSKWWEVVVGKDAGSLAVKCYFTSTNNFNNSM